MEIDRRTIDLNQSLVAFPVRRWTHENEWGTDGDARSGYDCHKEEE
jgi:hypothetical protein